MAWIKYLMSFSHIYKVEVEIWSMEDVKMAIFRQIWHSKIFQWNLDIDIEPMYSENSLIWLIGFFLWYLQCAKVFKPTSKSWKPTKYIPVLMQIPTKNLPFKRKKPTFTRISESKISRVLLQWELRGCYWYRSRPLVLL